MIMLLCFSFLSVRGSSDHHLVHHFEIQSQTPSKIIFFKSSTHTENVAQILHVTIFISIAVDSRLQ